MAWHHRKNRRPYYFHSRRQHDKVIHEHIGIGRFAELFSKIDELARLDRLARRQAYGALQAALEVPRSAEREFDALATLLIQASMLGAGYHRPQRCRWRKRRAETSS